MCDPLTIACAVLTAGSVAANSIAQSQVAAARNDALNAERIRQQGLDREADAINLRSQDRYQDFGGQQDRRATSLSDYFRQHTTAPTTGPQAAPSIPSSSTASNIVTREIANQQQQAADYGNQQAAALGNLRAFGDMLGEISRGQARDASLVGQIGSFKRGSSGVLGMELEQANNAGNGMRLLGDLAGGFGKLGVSAGLSGGTLGSLFGGGAPNVVSRAASSAASTQPVVGLGRLY